MAKKTDTPESLAERLSAEGRKSIEFFRALSGPDWDLKVYADGEVWSVQQILAHIVQAEDSVLRLIKHIIGGGAGAPPDFDLDGYNRRKVREFEPQNGDALLEMFAERRAQTVEWVAGLSPADLLKEGRHPFLGDAQVVDMLKLMYRHVQIHQRDIRKRIKNNTP